MKYSRAFFWGGGGLDIMDKDDKPRILSRIHMHVRRTNKIGRNNWMLIVVVHLSFFWGGGIL